MISTRKIKLFAIGNKEEINFAYKFIRDEQYEQYKGLNLCMTLLHTSNILESYNSGSEKKLQSQINKEKTKIDKATLELSSSTLKDSKREKLIKNLELYNNEINKLKNEYNKAAEYRTDIDVKFKELYTNDLYTIVQSQINLNNKDQMSLITQRAKKDYKTSLKNGLARGERSLTNYKRDFPLLVRNRDLRFSYIEESDEIQINWIRGIKFEVVLGNRLRENTLELRQTLHKCISKEYKICDSSIQIDGKDIILNLTIDIPENKAVEFIDGRCLGVDLGIKYPAYICLSDDTYKRKSIGSELELLKQRQQFKNRRKRLQEQLKLVKGGKGREKKLRALESLRSNERNFAKTYNHNVSKEIVDFALKHKCEFIKLEDLSNNSFDDKLLGSWGYYELQNMIEYKAERVGIKVVKVDPSYTSQTCSRCGHIDKENRPTQEKFKCTKCDFSLNADHNAAINISRK